METIVVNQSGKVTRQRMGGRDYLVAPVTMIVPGVLNGSRGPLLYPKEEIAKNPSSWNHIPLVIFHPYLNGLPISARDPDVINSQGVGIVLRSKCNKSTKWRLQAEAWFDEKAVERVDSRVYESLVDNKKIELSTGLDAEVVEADEGSIYNGQEYYATAVNLKPDHLAVLPDQTGACSISDGCGVLVNRRGEPKMSLVFNSKPVSGCSCQEGQVVWKSVKKLLAKAANKTSSVVNKAIRKPSPKAAVIEPTFTVNEDMSYEQQMSTIRMAFRESHPTKYDRDTGYPESYCYVIHVFDDYVIYDENNQMYRQYYSWNDGSVTFGKDSEPVKQQMTFVPVK